MQLQYFDTICDHLLDSVLVSICNKKFSVRHKSHRLDSLFVASAMLYLIVKFLTMSFNVQM